MKSERAIDVIKRMFKGEPTAEQLEALELAYEALGHYSRYQSHTGAKKIKEKRKMKKNDEHLMKFRITNDKLKMEIKLSDLVWLFHNSPNNVADDGESEFCRVKKGMKLQFAEEVVKMLMDQSPNNENNMRWSDPFESIFQEITESAADFLKYYDDI